MKEKEEWYESEGKGIGCFFFVMFILFILCIIGIIYLCITGGPA